RVAVGEHILLGGDNMDRALAYAVQRKLAMQNTKLDTVQMMALVHNCRSAKESLLADSKLQAKQITILGRGSKVIGGTIKTELTRAEVDCVILDGFFPVVEPNARPAAPQRLGFQELGLPYAADAAVTKHLARFLSQQVQNNPESANIRRGRGGLACPTHVLFNGGVMKADMLRERLVEVLNSWLTEEGFETLGPQNVLDAPDLEH